jgi:hypothetical protein
MATTNRGGSPVPVPGACPKAADRNAPISSMGQVYARDIVARAPKPSAKRPLNVRRPSAERPLELDGGIPRAHLGWQVEFITDGWGH